MPISSVELYEQLKPHLGEGETKSLIEYMDAKVKGEVATKEDLLILKGDLQKEMQGIKDTLREEIWKLRILMIAVMAIVIVFNPKVMEIIGKILGVVK